jgi:hypothetical protein
MVGGQQMSEKVIIKSVVDNKKLVGDKPIFQVELSDGRKGATYDKEFLDFKEGQEVELNIKEGKEYQGKMQYYFNVLKPDTKKSFAPRDYTFDKKRVALECAVGFSKGLDVKSADVIKVANYFFTEFLNK